MPPTEFDFFRRPFPVRYTCRINECRDAESLFVLVRDVREFEKTYARDVLEFVTELGFTGRDKEPQRVIQEGCLPFSPSSDSTTTAKARKVTRELSEALSKLPTLRYSSHSGHRLPVVLLATCSPACCGSLFRRVPSRSL